MLDYLKNRPVMFTNLIFFGIIAVITSIIAIPYIFSIDVDFYKDVLFGIFVSGLAIVFFGLFWVAIYITVAD